MESSQQLFNFIQDHENDDLAALRLKFSNQKNQQALSFDLEFALTQIEARRKSKRKIPTFVSFKDFLFPSILAAEQASNEAVARFHASLIRKDDDVLDMTAGLGIDSISMALSGAHITSCEIDALKCEVLRHNSALLGVGKNLNAVNCDSVAFLNSVDSHFDVIFVDPARRGSDGGKLHALADCAPDVLSAMPLMSEKADRVLVKASPLLDISLIKNSVENLNHIYVVCFRGECKEVLIDIDLRGERLDNAGLNTDVAISALDLDWNHTISRFDISPSGMTNIPGIDSDTYHLPESQNPKMLDSFKYLYEPNAAVMKIAPWTHLCRRYLSLVKADVNTHLFLADSVLEGFPGRALRIEKILDKKEMKRLKGCKVNVVARNHPLSAPLLEKKYGLIPGGRQFLYAFRYSSQPVFFLCTEISS